MVLIKTSAWVMPSFGIFSAAERLCCSSTWRGQMRANPGDDFKQLRKELELYDPKMLEKPYVVAANKMDMEESQAHLRSFKRRLRGVKVIELAAAFDEGVSPSRMSCEPWPPNHLQKCDSAQHQRSWGDQGGRNHHLETTSVMHACMD